MSAVVGTNSYITVAEADTYFSENYGYEAWDTCSDKDGALVSATKQLDLMCAWYGSKSDPDQGIEFPRAPDADPVPQEIKNAECEIAYSIVSVGSTATQADQEIKKVESEGNIEWFQGKPYGNQLINDLVVSMVKQYGLCAGNGSTTTIPAGRS